MLKNCAKSYSPIRYFGGKSGLAPTLINLLPEHKKYVEVFGGGAHLLAQKNPSKIEVYNDIDTDLVNFFEQAKNNGDYLTTKLLELPTSRFLFEKWKNEDFPDDDLERAVRWFYLIRQRIHPSNATLKSGWRAGRYKNLALDYQNAVRRIPLFSRRLQNVELMNQDFKDVILKHDGPDVCFFIDPPYVDREHFYKGNVDTNTHIQIAQLLNHIKGKAIVTYYDHPLINELYKGWYRVEVESFVSSSTLKEGEQRRKEKELILMNYNLNSTYQNTLF